MSARFWGPVLPALLAGCAAVAPPVAAPTKQPASPARARVAPAVPVETPISAERAALHAAIAAALEPAPAPASDLASDELAPIAALERDGIEEAPEPVSDARRLPPESVQRTVRQSRGRFRECYERALLGDPRLEGRIVVHFTIGSDGRVSRAEEESASLANRAARECVLGRFFELTFTNPSGRGIDVRYPLRFSRDGTTSDDLPSARHTAERPPPGFAEAMRAGRRVQPQPKAPPPIMVRIPPKSSCNPGDPMCDEL